MALNDQDFGLLQRTVDAILERIAELRLSYAVETDFRPLVAYLKANKAYLINPTFDPERSDLSTDAFWLRIFDEDGRTVGSHAQRLFHTDDFVGFFESGRIWYPDGRYQLGPGQEPWRITRPPHFIAGTVAYAGCLFIDPAYRKRGLAVYLPYLSRGLAFRNYDIDFFTCLTLRELAETPIPSQSYGYRHIHPMIDGFLPISGRNEQAVHICYLTREETVEQFRALATSPLLTEPAEPPQIAILRTA